MQSYRALQQKVIIIFGLRILVQNLRIVNAVQYINKKKSDKIFKFYHFFFLFICLTIIFSSRIFLFPFSVILEIQDFRFLIKIRSMYILWVIFFLPELIR